MTSSGTLRIGPAGWSYKDWRGIVYPERMSVHPVAYLSQYFDTIEINSSFYRPPNPRHAEAWVHALQQNPRFRFTAKLWQTFTHETGTWPGEKAVAEFLNGIQPLVDAHRFGCLLVQFPWSFRRTPENRTWLARIVEAFETLPIAVEVRHASWNRPEFFQGLRAAGAGCCNIDQPIFNDSIEPGDTVTASVAYVRFHGRNSRNWFRSGAGRDERYDYLYSPEELQDWESRIERIRSKASDVYVVTNNHFEGQAVVNALELTCNLLGRACPLPDTLTARYPQLQRLASKE